MAFRLDECRHTPELPVRGMTRIAVGDDALRFRCAICLGELTVTRCYGIGRGGRCHAFATGQSNYCGRHTP